MIKNLLKFREIHQERLKTEQRQIDRINDAILVCQETCPHEEENGKTTFVFIGNSHNYEIFRCYLCNKEEER